MKAPSLLIFFAIISITASCQESKKMKVPQSVEANFMSRYSGENDPDWELDSNGFWEAHFKIDGEKYRADFQSNGLWVETENSIKDSELPEAIKAAIKRDYKDEKITEVERVQHHSKGLFYYVEFKKDGKNKDVEYRVDGTVL
jgi:hypothetical protein